MIGLHNSPRPHGGGGGEYVWALELLSFGGVLLVVPDHIQGSVRLG
jgi:hypothetical protein